MTAWKNIGAPLKTHKHTKSTKSYTQSIYVMGMQLGFSFAIRESMRLYCIKNIDIDEVVVAVLIIYNN